MRGWRTANRRPRIGDVIELRPRRDDSPADQVTVEAESDVAQEQVETPNLPAVVEPDSVDLAVRPQPGRAPQRVQRPAWLGVRRQHRAALRSRLWDLVKAFFGRFAFEVWSLPRRGCHLLRWFFRGLAGHRNPAGDWVGGWPGVVLWCAAARERSDERMVPVQARRPGQTVRATEHADRIAVLHTLVLVVPHIAGVVAVRVWLPIWPWWLIFVPAIVATTVYGFVTDPKPPPPVVAPRAREHVGIESMNDALRALSILEKPTATNPEPAGVRLAAVPLQIGGGQESRWDLPASCGKEALDVVRLRGRLAGAFATPREQFMVEPGVHESQFIVWQAPRDPFGGPAPDHPLLDAMRCDVWNPVPFGHDARGRTVTISLVFSSLLIASRPRRGKSYSARSALAGAVLDPSTRFHCFDGKGGGTWEALAPLCDTFLEGGDDDDVAKVADALERLVADMRGRARRIPKSKITRETSRDPQVAAPVTLVIVDEAQEYLSHPEHGERVEEALIRLAKVGPSTGFCPVIITQRPDEKSFPTGLRAVLGARFALQVMSYIDSNVILGPDMSKLGHDASKIRHRGVGLLRPDDDADGEPDCDTSVRPVRTFDMSDEVWEEICAHGAELREQVEAEVPELEPGERGLLALVVEVLREHGDLSATGLLGYLPEPWDGLDPKQLGTELRGRGLRSHPTNQGRRYRLADVVVALSRCRSDDVVPRQATTRSSPVHDDATTAELRGHDGHHNVPRPTGTTPEEA